MKGERRQAVTRMLDLLNSHGKTKPLRMVQQFSFYLFHSGDPASAAVALESVRKDHPDDVPLLENLAVSLSRSGQYEAAVARTQDVVRLQPGNINAQDTLATTLHQLGRFDEAAAAGTRSLTLKDAAVAPAPPDWALPDTTPAAWAAMPGKRNVIAFSLWGEGQRYLRGALDNAMAIPTVYPGWTAVFYVDATVPQQVRTQLQALGAELRMQPEAQGIREKLAWRFKVANDHSVGRFLVRDADSLVSDRERQAVDAWIASDRWFHAMRDWWTHTDLLLAGMWGGVANVLPDLDRMLAAYRSRTLETPNIDQWFLRDAVWAYVRKSCLVHDRYFSPAGAQPWPQAEPPGTFHVGQNEYAVRPKEQQARLASLPADVLRSGA